MKSILELDWTFSPPEYFEEENNISKGNFNMEISFGRVHAEVEIAGVEAISETRRKMHELLNDRFLGAQLLAHRPYKLSSPVVSRLDSEGRRHYYKEAEKAQLRFGAPGIVDYILADPSGKIVRDSKRERIVKKYQFSNLVASFRSRDSTLASLIHSFESAMGDPGNEFVHLFEICDCLKKKFGTKHKTLSELSLSPSKWSRLGQLCNHEPLRQGRHRGLAGDTLRDATRAQLLEAREIASGMVEAYLFYLDKRTPN